MCVQSILSIQPADTAAKPDGRLQRQQDALVGRLIADAAEAECRITGMQEQLQQLQHAKR